jgi:hypothetical protein
MLRGSLSEAASAVSMDLRKSCVSRKDKKSKPENRWTGSDAELRFEAK